MVKKKGKSGRTSLKQKYKIKKRVRAHERLRRILVGAGVPAPTLSALLSCTRFMTENQ